MHKRRPNGMRFEFSARVTGQEMDFVRVDPAFPPPIVKTMRGGYDLPRADERGGAKPAPLPVDSADRRPGPSLGLDRYSMISGAYNA
jgi:hypothetical protein